MKIRQKIAMLLAAAMTFTAMPMMTMAQSDSKVVSGIQVNSKNQPINNAIRVEMKDATSEAFTFYVELDKAEFNNYDSVNNVVIRSSNNQLSAAGTLTGKKAMTVTVTPTGSQKADLTIPLNNIKLLGGDATVEINGNRTVISNMDPVIIGRTSDGSATVTVADAKNIYTDAKDVAKITIDEPYVGAITAGTPIKFEVRHSDYEIQDAVINYERGFTTNTTTSSNINDDVFSLVPGFTRGSGVGRITVVLKMKNTDKKPVAGDLNIKVSGEQITTTTVKVADVKNYGVTVEMDDKKVVDVVAGQSEEITFKIKENVPGTFVANDREFDVEFNGAYLWNRKIDDTTTEGTIFAALQAYENLNNADGEFELKDLILDEKSEFVVGMTFALKATNEDTQAETELEIKDLPVYVPLSYSGDVKVTVSGRALGGEASTVAVNAKAAVKVTAEPITVKVGLKEQTGGKVVIQEENAGIFEQGEYIYLKIDNDTTALKFKDEDFTSDKIAITSGDLVLDLVSADVSGGTFIVKVKRSSTVASTITIKDLTVYSDRTVPQGTYDLKLGGIALSSTDNWSINRTSTEKDITIKGFINVATPNTEDIATNGLQKGTSSFVIGSAKYLVNGKEFTMDGAPYVNNGRTMVPVRYVANALGVASSDIYFANGTATVIAGAKTVSLTVGDKVAKLNGVPAKAMESAPVVKDGRTYVPVSEIGALLGVEATWDSASQTATFTNK